MLKKIPVYLFLLPVFVIIHVAAEFKGLINFRIVWPGMLMIFVAQFAIVLFSRLFSRDIHKVALIAFAFSLVYFFFPDLKDYLLTAYPRSRLTSYSVLLPVILVILFLIVRSVKRSTSTFKKFSRFLNLLFVLGIAADLPALFGSGTSRVFKNSDVKLSEGKKCDTCVKPDVYFLLFDAYTSTNTLRSEFGFENSSLDSFLSEKGFFVAGNSTSNYALTPLSVSSCFNMNYLHFRDSIRSVNLKTYLSAVDLVNETIVPEYFSSKGYKIINESIFNLHGISPSIRPYDIWNQDEIYARQHFYYKLYSDIGWHARITTKNQNTLRKRREMRDGNVDANLSLLKETIRTSEPVPRFVYAHFLIPHEPYSRGARGEELPYNLLDIEAERKKGYVRQAQYCNGIIRDLVSNILDHTKRPVVIMVLGDHGYRFDDDAKNHLAFPNLNAIYFSNKDYHQMKQDHSLVNNFRFVLNSYFGEKLPILKDSSSYLPYK